LSDRPKLEDLIEVRRQFRLPHEALVEKDWLVVPSAYRNRRGQPSAVPARLSGRHGLEPRSTRDRTHVGRHRHQIVSEGSPPRPALRRLRESITAELHKAGSNSIPRIPST